MIGVRCQSEGPPVHSQKFHTNATSAEIHAWARAACGEPRVEPDIFFEHRSVVPALPPDCDVEVWYVEQEIEALGAVGRLLQSYHCGLVFHVSTLLAPPPLTVFTLQYYAVDFPFGALFPISVEDGAGPVWNNEAVVAFTPGEDPHRWTKGRSLVGRTTGAIVNALCDWVVSEFTPSHPGYQLFDVLDAPQAGGATRTWVSACVCDTFVHASLRQLPSLGAHFTSQQPLYRNYVPLISPSAPERVDLSNVAERAALNGYYSALLELVTRGLGARTLPQLLHWLAERLEYVYIHDARSGGYHRVELAPPYLCPSRLYQRMALPWQPGSEVVEPDRQPQLSTSASGRSADTASAMAADELFRDLLSGTRSLLMRRGYAAIGGHRRQRWMALAGAALAVAAGLAAAPRLDGVAGLSLGLALGAAAGFVLGRLSASPKRHPHRDKG